MTREQLIVVKKYKETATADDRSIMSVSMLQELVFQEFSYSSVTRIFTNVPTPRILITLISTDDQIRVDTKDTVNI